MAGSDPPIDLSRLSWFFPEWLEAQEHGVTEHNALEYFSLSPFFDRQSSNQVLKMQRMHTGLEADAAEEEEHLKRFTGVEFALVHARPPTLFVIHKRERFSPTEASPIAAYYILNNNIYEAQSMHTLLSGRMTTSITALQSSLDLLRSTLTSASPFNPRSESQFVLSKAVAPPLLPDLPAHADGPSTPAPAPGTPNPAAPSAASSAKPTTSTVSEPPTSSLSLLLALRTTLSSLPSLLASSSTAPSPIPAFLPHHYGGGGGSLGGRTPSYLGGGSNAGTPASFLQSYRNTPSSVGGPGMVPTPPASAKNKGSPEDGGTGGGGAKKKRRRAKPSEGGAGGSGGGGGGGGGTPGSVAGGTPGGLTPGMTPGS